MERKWILGKRDRSAIAERDLMMREKYMSQIGSGHHIEVMSRIIAEGGPSRYAVSPERAYTLIIHGRRGEYPGSGGRSRLAHWLVDEYNRARESGLVRSVTDFVANRLPGLRAPELFITPASAYRRIVSLHHRRWP